MLQTEQTEKKEAAQLSLAVEEEGHVLKAPAEVLQLSKQWEL